MGLVLEMYKPLHEALTIKESGIHGLGVYATKDIPKRTYLGISHVPHEDYDHGYVRTPLGGFINHSEEPNCAKIKVCKTEGSFTIQTLHMYIETLEDIKVGEELTVFYTLYTPKEKEDSNK